MRRYIYIYIYVYTCIHIIILLHNISMLMIIIVTFIVIIISIIVIIQNSAQASSRPQGSVSGCATVHLLGRLIGFGLLLGQRMGQPKHYCRGT